MKKLAIALIAVFGISGVAFAEPTLDASLNKIDRMSTLSVQVQVPAEGIYSFNA